MVTSRPLSFLYTNSYDHSADLLVKRVGNDRLFRFNLDLWRDYRVQIESDRFFIGSPAGRTADSNFVIKFLWRKPLTGRELFPERRFERERVYEDEELAYAMRELWNRMYYEGRAILIDPASDVLAGKLTQSQVATRYFAVPRWEFVSGMRVGAERGRQCVVKSLTSLRVGEKRVLFTTRVSEDQLAPASPWMVQDYVAAQRDVTVLVVRDALFAFEVDRSEFPPGVVDWRHARTLAPAQEWRRHELPDSVARAIREFMDDMALHYGRLDFLLSGKDYCFLEVNPNGEWAWLDPQGDAGVLEKLSQELSPDTPCHPLPNPRVIKSGLHGKVREGG